MSFSSLVLLLEVKVPHLVFPPDSNSSSSFQHKQAVSNTNNTSCQSLEERWREARREQYVKVLSVEMESVCEGSVLLTVSTEVILAGQDRGRGAQGCGLDMGPLASQCEIEA